MRGRSNSHEQTSSTPDVMFSRALSYDSTFQPQDSNVSRRTSTFHGAASYCRQSTISSNQPEDEQSIQDGETSNKLINNTRELLILIGMALIEFTGTSAMSVIAPFFAPEAANKGANSTVVGLIFAIYPLIVFCLSPLVGKWMPRVGVKFCLIAGCFLEGGSLMLFGFVDDLPEGWVFIVYCFCIRSVTAIGSSMSATASLSILTVTFKKHIGTVYGIVETFTGLGFMAGPALGGVLYQHGGFKIPFIVSAGIVLLVLFCVFFILPGEDAYHQHNEDGTEEELSSITQTLKVPGIAAVGICVITAGMALSFFDPTLTPFLKEIKPDITTEQVGLIFLSLPASFTFIAPLVGFIVDKGARGRYFIIFGQLGLSVGYFFMGPSPLIQSFIKRPFWLVIVSGIVIGATVGPFVVPILGDMQRSAKNAGLPMTLGTDSLLSGFFNGFFSIGSVIGPTLGGVLSQYWSFEGACTVFAFLSLAEALLMVLFTIWESNSKWSGKKDQDGFKKLEEEA